MSLGVLLLNQMVALRNSGFTVVGVSSAGPYLARIEQCGIAVENVPLPRRISPGRDLLSFLALVRIFRRLKPQIVHTHSPKAALLGQYAALVSGVPIRVHTIHGLYLQAGISSAKRRAHLLMEKSTMRFATHVLSQNPEDIPVAVQYGMCSPENITLLGNGIDLRRFDPANVSHDTVSRLRETLGIPAHAKVVGLVARMNREKGIETFFDAARRIVSINPDVRFLLIGPVEDKHDALDPAKLALEVGVAEQTIYIGSRQDMPELYSVMDVLVLPSLREGFPRSPMEAAAMQRAVVATNIRGCRQVVVDNETGFLVAPRDAEQLADRILALLTDDRLRASFAAAARNRALQEFDEERVIARTLRVYDDLLRKHRARPGVHFALGR